MKFLYFSLVFVLLYTSLSAQEHYISYYSEAENQQLSARNDYKSMFKLALLSGASNEQANEYISRADAFALESGWSDADAAKPQKKLKKLFTNIHNNFLKIYDEKATMADMFNSGKYQCVTASLLYGYLLETLRIPYQIKEEPTHVYVVAYPQSHNILIETTDPAKGYFMPSEKEKANYVNGLIKEKYLDEPYVKKVGVEQAFNEFFYGKESISLTEAVGLTYYNQALEQIDLENYPAAYSAIYKANKLYPAKKHEYLKINTLGLMLTKMRFDQLQEWEALVYFVNMEKSEDAKSYLKSKFQENVDRNLWKSSHPKYTDSVYNFIAPQLTDSVLKSEIEDHYLQERARSLYMGGKPIESTIFLEKAYHKNPENTLVKAMIKDNLLKNKLYQSGSLKNIDTLNLWIERYPYLAPDPDIHAAYLYNYITLSHEALRVEDFEKGALYGLLMMDELDHFDHQKYKPEEIIALNISGTAFYYYQTKKDKVTAKKIIERGIKQFPNDPLLSTTLKRMEQGKFF